MRNRQPQDGHTPQQNGHIQLSPGTIQDLAEQLRQRTNEANERGARAAMLHTEAQQCDLKAQALRDEIVQAEQTLNRLRGEFQQTAERAQAARQEAADWENAKADSKQRATDLEQILRAHAPEALAQLDAQNTPPQGQPHTGEPALARQPAPGDKQVAQASASALETAAIPVQPKGGQRP